MRLHGPAQALSGARDRAPLLCGALLVGASLAVGAAGSTAGAAPQTLGGGRPLASATLVGCVTASEQDERSATFAGEMTAIPGSAHLEVRIDLLERLPQQTQFHTVTAPGLGIWRGSAPGVKVFRDLKLVTNLSAPAFYRGALRFRWLNARGRLMRSEELRTPRCEQPAPPSSTPSVPAAAPAGA